MSDDTLGFIFINNNVALFGTLSGNTKKLLHKFTINPKKNKPRDYYVNKTSDLATQFFIDPSTGQPNVSGLVLAGSTDLKTELSRPDSFDQSLQDKVLNVLDANFGMGAFLGSFDFDDDNVWTRNCDLVPRTVS